MEELINNMGAWGVPTVIISIVVGIFVIMQLIGEIIEWCGKTAPMWLKIRKYFSEKKRLKKEREERLIRIDEKFARFEVHYSPENIEKRDRWMNWVNERSEKYDESIALLSQNLVAVTEALEKNTKVTDKMFIQDCRTIILSFAEKAAQDNVVISREEFNRVFKVYDDYEQFLEEHNQTNGEVDIAINVIREGYEHRLRNHSFLEDIRGYNKN